MLVVLNHKNGVFPGTTFGTNDTKGEEWCRNDGAIHQTCDKYETYLQQT